MRQFQLISVVFLIFFFLLFCVTQLAFSLNVNCVFPARISNTLIYNKKNQTHILGEVFFHVKLQVEWHDINHMVCDRVWGWGEVGCYYEWPENISRNVPLYHWLKVRSVILEINDFLPCIFGVTSLCYSSTFHKAITIVHIEYTSFSIFVSHISKCGVKRNDNFSSKKKNIVMSNIYIAIWERREEIRIFGSR